MMPEIKSGIFPGAGTIVLMTKVLGIPWTKKILMFAEEIKSERAQLIGLIDEVVETQENLMKLSLKKASYLSTKNQLVVNGIKLCSNHLLDKSYNKAYRLEKEFLQGWVKTKDKKQFLEKFREQIINL